MTSISAAFATERPRYSSHSLMNSGASVIAPPLFNIVFAVFALRDKLMLAITLSARHLRRLVA
jgi:hypothetical protein